MGYFEESKLKKLQGLLESSKAPKEIIFSVKTAYVKLGKRFNLKDALKGLRSGNKSEDAKETSFDCPNKDCGHVFNQPLRALQIRKDKKIAFYGCPRCLSEIEVEDYSMLPGLEGLEQKAERESEPEQILTPNTPSGCRHHLGYLAEKDSKASIPDECMICKDLMDCTHKK